MLPNVASDSLREGVQSLLLASTHFASNKFALFIIIDSMNMDTKWQVPTIGWLVDAEICWGLHPQRDKDYRIQSNFWKFYLIRIDFTLGDLVSFVKVFRLFELEQMFVGVQSVDTVGRCTTSYLLARPACLWRLVLLVTIKNCIETNCSNNSSKQEGLLLLNFLQNSFCRSLSLSLLFFKNL
jgi:hypothetical protein